MPDESFQLHTWIWLLIKQPHLVVQEGLRFGQRNARQVSNSRPGGFSPRGSMPDEFKPQTPRKNIWRISSVKYKAFPPWLGPQLCIEWWSRRKYSDILRGGGTSFFQVKLKKFSPSSKQNHEFFLFCKPLNSSEAKASKLHWFRRPWISYAREWTGEIWEVETFFCHE